MSLWIAKQYKVLVICFFALIQTNCSIIAGPTLPNDSLSEYAEALFKRQNQITQQVMMMFEVEVSLIDEEKIATAELNMHDACHLLNEYANREMEGKELGLFFRRRVQASLRGCDQSVQTMETILTEIVGDSELSE